MRPVLALPQLTARPQEPSGVLSLQDHAAGVQGGCCGVREPPHNTLGPAPQRLGTGLSRHGGTVALGGSTGEAAGCRHQRRGWD